MADFSGYAKKKLTGKTAWLEIADLTEQPIRLECAPAIGNANKAYRLEMMRVKQVVGEVEKANAKTPEQQLEAAQRIEGGITNALCEAVVVGWAGVVDTSTGEAVPFSRVELAEFFRQAPEDLPDRVYAFASNSKNFHLDDPAVISKNSERG